MSKGYWVVHVDVHDNETYAKYREANSIAFEKFTLFKSAKFL